MKLKKIGIAIFATLVFTLSNLSFAQGPQYRVTVTNITKNQIFTPIIGVGHTSAVSLFTLGQQASEELAAIAESGDIAPMQALLSEVSNVSTSATEGLLMPGSSAEFIVTGNYNDMRLSLAAMLLPTNDTFVAVNSLRVPYFGSAVTFARAYDAGSETNDELCASIPGPQCGGSPGSPEDDGEGFVHVSSGIHGIGDLKPSVYDWRDAVARVEVQIMY